MESGRVSTDTRKIEPGSIFFALKGERFNANDFALSALEKGARYAVVDEVLNPSNDRLIVVENVLETLQQLATYHRRQFSIPVIGLTGSNGKTTSKELMSAVLRKKYNLYATQGNLNNHIGVPLTLLEINVSTEIAVVEMGANHVGEIAALCAIANPTHGLITNIGKAHIGTFGGFENIVRAKSELYQYLISNEGVAFINSGNDILFKMSTRFKNPVFYPAKNDYYHCELIEADPFLRILAENGEIIQTNLLGRYNFENIAAALCIGKYFEVDGRDANRAISEFTPDNMRSQLILKNDNKIILDAYNANPSSMRAAIVSLAEMPGANKTLILGDMYELEEEAEEEHRNIGRLLTQYSFDNVILCGDLMKSAKEEYPRATVFSDKSRLTSYLIKNPVTKSTILIKASRGMGLETILEYI
jgi:UDP-N-acetylmuramoyl-tripeptide--D-alanyl-D-alanine ligase